MNSIRGLAMQCGWRKVGGALRAATDHLSLGFCFRGIHWEEGGIRRSESASHVGQDWDWVWDSESASHIGKGTELAARPAAPKAVPKGERAPPTLACAFDPFGKLRCCVRLRLSEKQ